MLEGSCACGRVRYRIDGELLGPITYCHCWRCRKHSGSSFGTTAGIRADALEFVAGEDALASWTSSPGIERFFASCCGSPIFKRDASSPELLGFRLGTLDTGKIEARRGAGRLQILEPFLGFANHGQVLVENLPVFPARLPRQRPGVIAHPVQQA